MILQIVFRFGEHFYEEPASSIWQSVLLTMLGSLFGFLIALYIYRLSVRKDEHLKIKAKKKLYLSKIQYFNELLTSIVEYTENQSKHYIELGKQILLDPYELHYVTQIAFNGFNRIFKLESDQFIDAFISLYDNDKTAANDYYNAYSVIDYLDEKFKQLLVSQEKHINFIHRDQRIIMELINDLSDDVATLLYRIKLKSESPKAYEENPYVLVLDNSLGIFKELSDKESPIFDYEIHFSKLLRERLVHEFRESPDADQLTRKSHQAAVIFKQIKFNSEEHAKQATQVEEEIQNQRTKIKEINERISHFISKHISDT